MPTEIHRAKFVLAEPDLLLQNAAIHIVNPGQVSGVESWNHSSPPDAKVVDWGCAVILPGLVNAHAHLELTALHGELTRFRSFTDWLSQLIEKRRHWTKEEYLKSVRAGAEEALKSGTTLIGDVTASGWGFEGGAGVHLRRVVFEEVTALSPANLDSTLSQIQARMGRALTDSLVTQAISPHAPYSVSPQLYCRLAALCRDRGLLLATHVAETQSEIDFLREGIGEFRDFLLQLGVLPEGWTPPQLSPIAYLDSLGVLGPHSVLIHCNYLDQDSMNRILMARSNVVYCPRSHDFFCHGPHPVRRLLDLGINVALGTDSLASNHSLGMLEEMRHLFRTRQDLKPEEIFRAATLNGAAALNFGGSLGRLQRGYWADLTVLELPENIGPRSLQAQVLEGAGECIATVVQGQIAWCKPDIF